MNNHRKATTSGGELTYRAIIRKSKILFAIILFTIIPCMANNELTPGECKIYGQLVGYDDKSGLDMLRLYGNMGILFDDDKMDGLPVNPDGTFSSIITIDFPSRLWIEIDNEVVEFYAEPNSEVELTIDYSEILRRQENEDFSEDFNAFTVEGSLAEYNRILAEMPRRPISPNDLRTWHNDCYPSEFKEKVLSANTLWLNEIEAYIDSVKPDNKLAEIMRMEPYSSNVDDICRYATLRALGTTNPGKRGDLPSDFYDFIKDSRLDNPLIFATSDGLSLQNRIEYSFLNDFASGGRLTHSLEIDSIMPQETASALVYKRFFEVDTLPLTIQSVVANDILSSIKLAGPDKDYAFAIADSLFAQFITYPLIRQRAMEQLEAMHSESRGLDEGKGFDILISLLAPYLGKTIVIDFWGTTCGPCIAAIRSHQEVIKQYTNSDEVKFVFITDELSSPNVQVYEKFVNQYLDGQTVFRLDRNDYSHLAVLFGINAIPRYVIMGKDCTIKNPNCTNGFNIQNILQNN